MPCPDNRPSVRPQDNVLLNSHQVKPVSPHHQFVIVHDSARVPKRCILCSCSRGRTRRIDHARSPWHCGRGRAPSRWPRGTVRRRSGREERSLRWPVWFAPPPTHWVDATQSRRLQVCDCCFATDMFDWCAASQPSRPRRLPGWPGFQAILSGRFWSDR